MMVVDDDEFNDGENVKVVSEAIDSTSAVVVVHSCDGSNDLMLPPTSNNINDSNSDPQAVTSAVASDNAAIKDVAKSDKAAAVDAKQDEDSQLEMTEDIEGGVVITDGGQALADGKTSDVVVQSVTPIPLGKI